MNLPRTVYTDSAGQACLHRGIRKEKRLLHWRFLVDYLFMGNLPDFFHKVNLYMGNSEKFSAMMKEM